MNSRRSRGERRPKVAELAKGRNGKPTTEKIDEFQPKILRKPESCKEENEVKKVNLEVQKLELPTMTKSVRLINKNRLDIKSLFDYLHPENSNFYVVGVIGMKFSGKTTIMNLIATGDYKRCDIDKKFYIEHSPFGETCNNGVDAFITKDRLILLDSAPVLHNESGREFILSETDDFRQVQTLFRLCHELVIVYESSQIMNLTRVLICAKQMMQRYECDEPFITLIENRVQPGLQKSPLTDFAMKYLSKNVSDSINSIQLPDIARVAYYHDDPREIVSKLRDDINTRKELKAFEEPTETEKTWWTKFTKIDLTGGLLLKEFEALREKFYQPNEN